MTLGSTPSPAQIVAELGEGFPFTFPGADSRWLAEVGASDPVIFPTSFANKTSIKIEDIDTTTGSGGSATFTGVDFGVNYIQRTLIACVGLYANAAVALNQVSCTIGGFSAVGNDSGEFLAGGPSVGAGVWVDSAPIGTSGNVTINWTGYSGSVNAGLVLLSACNMSTSTFDHTASWNGGGSGGSSTGNSLLDIPANGILIAAIAHGNTNNTSLGGVAEQTEFTFGGARLCVGFANRKGAQSDDAVSASWSGSTAYGGEARSYVQG